jgi:hypothetical protein
LAPSHNNCENQKRESANYLHTPFLHTAGAVHVVPHAPQLALSLPKFEQLPLQSARPGPQEEQQRKPVSAYEKFCASAAAMKVQPRPTE